jgi:hypothetical protein
MKKLRLIGLFLLVVLLGTVGTAAANDNFVAHLAGRNEVPAVDTRAQGEAIFHLSEDGTELHYKLIVANINNVFASHIHCGAEGVSGPVGVTLFSGDPDGRVDGILAQGTITAPNPGNACGWTDLAAVVDAMQSGNTYVNVHTEQNRGGEIRGQIR